MKGEKAARDDGRSGEFEVEINVLDDANLFDAKKAARRLIGENIQDFPGWTHEAKVALAAEYLKAAYDVGRFETRKVNSHE